MNRTEPLADFQGLRIAVRSRRIGDGGWDTCRALTASLDAAIRDLAAGVIDSGLAVVAVGGYGRAELCLHSDVDVMLLHSGTDLQRATGSVLYPLWDANLKVGHSVRTVREAVEVAGDDFDTLTSLLTMRHICGDESLVDELEGALARTLRTPLTSELVDREMERRDVDPYPVMSADLKEGRGGLRSYQSLHWARRRAALLGSDPGPVDDGGWYGRLLAARNALHAATGRAVDRFHVDLRSPAARWLGLDVGDLAAQVCTALHRGDRLVEMQWPEVLGIDADAGRKPRRGVWWLGRGRSTPDVASEVAEPAVRTALRLAGVPEAERQGAAAMARLQRAAWQRGTWTDGDRAAFLDLLRSGPRGRAAWSLLDEIGWTSNHLPEWRSVLSRPQLAPFHDHPVDAHLWRAVDEMISVMADPTDDRAGIAADVDSPDDLLLAAFFHDIGKGSGRDHAEAGADVAEAALSRFGFGAATVSLIATVTRHHLLLSETATRRDLDDPAVIDEVADAVGDLKTLQVLYLLSIADARATGSAMLTEWKASLLRTAYSRIASRLGDVAAQPEQHLAAAIAVAADRYPADHVEWHIRSMDQSYLFANTSEDIVWHLDLLADVAGRGTSAAQLAVRNARHGSRVAVAATDRTGLLGDIATVFALHGISVLGARLYTRTDGVVLDVFDVEDDIAHESVSEAKWQRVRHDLADEDRPTDLLDESLRQRARAYSRQAVVADVSVRAPRAATTSHSVIEVRCGDRIGRLAEIVAALYAEDLDISVAKLDTRAGHVVDTFYVTRNGRRIDNSEEILRTVTSIRDRLRR